MKSIFTDCPHREKLGWLEQTHLIGPAVLYNFDVHTLYKKIQKDMAQSQYEKVWVPSNPAPNMLFLGTMRVLLILLSGEVHV